MQVALNKHFFCFLLSQVAAHDTVDSCWPAMMEIPIGTMVHLEAFAKLRPFLPGYGKQPRRFFFTKAGKAMKKIGAYFMRSWKSCDLPGAPKLQDIRTAIST